MARHEFRPIMAEFPRFPDAAIESVAVPIAMPDLARVGHIG